MKRLIYFDSAATSFPKPKSVSSTVMQAFVSCGGNPGRSSHALSYLSAKAVFNCRESVCRLFHFSTPENVIFTYNTTYALNMAIKGLVCDNCHILISNLEHNSVLRPVHALSEAGRGITYGIFDALADDDKVIENFNAAVTPETKLAVITMASNVCGKLLPITGISKVCKKHGILLIVDAAQGAGCMNMDFGKLGADVICCAGHKGLYGPMGTGLCVFAEGLTPESIIQGGNGVNSAQREMACPLPEMLEAGTLGVPSICGLNAGIEYVISKNPGEIFDEGIYLAEYLSDGLKNIRGVTIYGESLNRTPCVLFNLDGTSSENLGSYLSDRNICVRSGLHCSPLAHESLKTGTSGAVRASLSHMNTLGEIDSFLMAVKSAADKIH